MEFCIEFSRKHVRAYMEGYTNKKIVIVFENYHIVTLRQGFEGAYQDFLEMSERLLAGYGLRCDTAKVQAVADRMQEAWENSRSCHLPAQKGDFFYVNV